MIIGVDIDQTFMDTMKPWIKCYNEDFGDDLKVEEITSWKVHDFVVKEAKEAIYDYIKGTKVFEMADPIDGAIDAILYLKSQGYRIIFPTANNPQDIKTKILMNYKVLEDSKDIYTCEDKSLIVCDFLVDDKPENVENAYGVGILFTAKHNENFNWHPRANNWEEVIGIIEGWSDNQCTF